MKKLKLFLLLTFTALIVGVNAQDSGSIKESKLLAMPAVKEFAKRVGDSLIFKFDNGTSENFINAKRPIYNEDENGQKVIYTIENPETGKIDTSFVNEKFIFSGTAFDGKYLIIDKLESSDEFEGGRPFRTMLLVSKKSGTQIKDIQAVFSPNKNRFITLQNQASPEVVVSNINNEDNIVVEFDLKPRIMEWEPEDVKWLSNTEFKIIRSNPDTGKKLSPLIYKFDGTKWVLATATPVKKSAPAAKKTAPVAKKPIKK